MPRLPWGAQVNVARPQRPARLLAIVLTCVGAAGAWQPVTAGDAACGAELRHAVQLAWPDHEGGSKSEPRTGWLAQDDIPEWLSGEVLISTIGARGLLTPPEFVYVYRRKPTASSPSASPASTPALAEPCRLDQAYIVVTPGGMGGRIRVAGPLSRSSEPDKTPAPR